MQTSKILFSEEELMRAENSEWILTKNRIIKKIMSLFGDLCEVYVQLTKEYSTLPSELISQSPKISRGEQHRGLPYVMLDYPRIFSKENVFAVRTFFWWGNYFSLTLHLKGIYKNQYQQKILENVDLLSKHNFFLAVSENEWRQDFEEENYVPLEGWEPGLLKKNILQKEFLKIAVRWPLHKGNHLNSLAREQFSILLEVINR